MTQSPVVYVHVDDRLVRSVGTKRIPVRGVVERVHRLHGEGYVLFRSRFLATTSAFFSIWGAARADEVVSSDEVFPPDAVRADLDAIWSALIDVGADPFRAAKRQDVERRYQDARAAIVGPCTLRQAWLAIAPVLGALNDD